MIPDIKIATGTLLTAMSITAPTWLEQANLAATLIFTLLVGGLTAWYTILRIIKLRKDK